jgi:hypothetical protein
LVFIPGRDANYDACEAPGNKSWGSTDMLKCFKKQEHFEELKGYSSWFNKISQTLHQEKDMELAVLSIQALEYGD